MARSCEPNRTDLVSNKRAFLLLWRVPWVAVAVSLWLKDSPLKTAIWTVAFAQMGIACLANASRCGRLHCYFTGPLYLLGSAASLLRGCGRLPITWSKLGLAMFVGWLILGRLPEKLWGKYARLPSLGADRFDRFTDRARWVLHLAQEEAQGFKHNYIGTEHMLLGLIREDQGVAAKVLSDRGARLDTARSAVEHIVGRGDHPTRGPVSLTPRAKRVIEFSVDEARRLRHDYIGTEHLLLGVVREGEGVAVGVLDSLKVSTNLKTMREQINQLLRQN